MRRAARRGATALLTGLLAAVLPAAPVLAGTAPPPPLSTTHACPTGVVPEAWMLDVPSTLISAAAINCLQWWSVTFGTSPYRYSPAAAVTRGQMALFLTRVITNSGGTLPPPKQGAFNDDGGTIYQQADDELAAAGIASGEPDGGFHPLATVTRGQMAKFLYNTYSYRASGSVTAAPTAASSYFSDVPVGSLFADDIMAVANEGFAAGYPDGTYRPAGDVSRAQMAIFLTRMLEKAVTDLGAAPPAAAPARAGDVSYAAGGTAVYVHQTAGTAADSLVYTAPSGSVVTATALSPDASQIAVAVSTFTTSNGVVTAGQTSVVVLPVAGGGGAPNPVDGGAFPAAVVTHLSWGHDLLASVVDPASGPAMYLLSPAGAAPQRVGGTAGQQCGSAESLTGGAVVFSDCADATGAGPSVLLVSSSGTVYGPLVDAPGVVAATPSPDGTSLALLRIDVTPSDQTVMSVQVAGSVLGTARTLASVTTAAGAASAAEVDAVGWQDAGTLLYDSVTRPASGGAPTAASVEGVSAAGGSAPTALPLTGSTPWALSALPALS